MSKNIMDFQRYVDLFWVNIHKVFCIIDTNTPQEDIEEIQYQFKRLGIDNKLTFYVMTEGSIDNPYEYFKAIQHICKIESEMQEVKCNHDMQPLAIFKGFLRFLPFNLPLLIRVATALNIYHCEWDIFNLACEQSTYSKKLLKNDVYEGSGYGDNALLLSANTIRQLAVLKAKRYNNMTMPTYMSSVKQLFLSQPICVARKSLKET